MRLVLKITSVLAVAAMFCLSLPSSLSVAGAQVIEFGETRPGRILCGVNDEVFFEIKDVAARIIIYLSECSDLGSCVNRPCDPCFDTFLDVRGANGDHRGTGGNRLGDWLLPRGVYKTRISAGSDRSGTYSLFVQRTHEPRNAIGLGAGSVVHADAIDVCGEIDTYTFEGEQDEIVRIEMQAVDSEIAPLLDVFYPSGKSIGGRRRASYVYRILATSQDGYHDDVRIERFLSSFTIHTTKLEQATDIGQPKP